MLNKKIRELREQLNSSISREESFDKIYELSIELDKLIAEYYKEKKTY